MDDLVTTRLILHPLSVAEAEQIAAGISGGAAHWTPGYPAPGDIAGAQGFLHACAALGDPQPLGGYEIRRREDGQAIGGIGFRDTANQQGRATIGYGVVPSVRGNGYATEALRAMLTLARNHGITCVEGDADLDNLASQHVMLAAGMQLSAEDDQLRHYRIVWP